MDNKLDNCDITENNHNNDDNTRKIIIRLIAINSITIMILIIQKW